jgi:hypothetical protein
MVYEPIPRPPPPLLNQEAGTEASRTYYVQVAWVDAAGRQSLASRTAAITTQEGTRLTVRTAGAPSAARGWRVYAGYSEDLLQEQSGEPLALGSIWAMATAGLAAGAMPGEGQAPDTYLRQLPVLQRG